MFDYVQNMRLSLVINKVSNKTRVDQEPISLIRKKNQQSVAGWYRCGKCGAVDKNIECLCCSGVEAVEYFELLGFRYRDMNAVSQRI